MNKVASDGSSLGKIKFGNGVDYFRNYEARRAGAMSSVAETELERAFQVLSEAVESRRSAFVCGNGGSTAVSNHMICDFNKGIRTGTGLRPRFHSLSTSIETIMAIANDISFEEVFSFQLESLADKGDVLVTISSSGNSPNILRAMDAAKTIGMTTIALTGFDGGGAAKRADINLHVSADNYGIVEDCHQSLMHILAQFLRQSAMSEEAIRAAKF